MKNKLYFIAAIMMTVFVSSCPVTAEENVLEEAIENLEKTDSIKGTFHIGYEMEAEEFTASASLSGEMEEIAKPEIYHITSTMGMDMFDFTIDMETYGEVQEEELIVYNSELMDEWYKNTYDTDSKASLKKLLNLEEFVVDAILAEETATYNDQEVYILSASYEGAFFNNLLYEVFNAVSNGVSLDIDFENAVLNTEIKIYKESMLPAAVTMTVVEEDLASVVHDQEEMELTSFRYEVQIQEYNTIESIEIPEEALAAENYTDEEFEMPEAVIDEAGNYVLSDYEEKVCVAITPLEGYAASDYCDPYYLSFYPDDLGEEDGYVDLSYYLTELSEEWTESGLKELFSTQDEYLTEEYGCYDVAYHDFQTVEAGDLMVNYAYYTYNDGGSMWYDQYYAYAVTEDGFALEVYLYEEAYDAETRYINEELIISAFKAVGNVMEVEETSDLPE